MFIPALILAPLGNIHLLPPSYIDPNFTELQNELLSLFTICIKMYVDFK